MLRKTESGQRQPYAHASPRWDCTFPLMLLAPQCFTPSSAVRKRANAPPCSCRKLALKRVWKSAHTPGFEEESLWTGTTMAAHPVVKPTILCVSPDLGLLISRSQILRHAGYDVIAAVNRHIAVLAVANHQVDLALLCYAFPRDEAEQIEHDLLTISPQLSIVQLQDYDGMEMKEEAHSPEMLRHLVRAALSTHVAR